MAGAGKTGKEDAPEGVDGPTQVRAPEASAAVAPLPEGSVLGGDYRVLSAIGNDETSISYKAEDLNLGIPVLIKELAPAGLVTRASEGAPTLQRTGASEHYEAARARFMQEAQTLVRFRHPSIVRAHRVFEDNATKYIVLDYEEGEPFDVWLADLGRPPTQSELDRLVRPLLSALASVHSAGYVHANIRPSSILVRYGASPVLVDFAGACEASAPNAGTLPIRGDAAYAAPERRGGATGRCGPWTDLFGFAAVLYLAVTGKSPGDEDRQNAAASAPEGYRPEFLAAIDQALASEVDARPQSVDAWEGIRAPEEPEPESFNHVLADPELPPVGSDVPGLRADSHARTSLSRLATRVISVLPEAQEETDIPKYDFERWLLPAALTSALLGALLFSTGMNFALAAVFQVAATGLFFLRGYMPLSRYLSHTTRQPEAVVRRAEQATQNAAWMIFAIFAVMIVNPLFVERFVSSSAVLPLSVLSAFMAIPAVLMAACGYLGMPVRWSLTSMLAGAANAFVVVFNVLLFGAFAYTLSHTAANAVIHPALQVNRYLYIIATVAGGTLGVLIFMSRAAARQRIKQAAVSR